MTDLQKAINFLRFGEYGDYVESDDGAIRITRLSHNCNTVPNCYIIQNGDVWETNAFFSEVVPILVQMYENV